MDINLLLEKWLLTRKSYDSMSAEFYIMNKIEAESDYPTSIVGTIEYFDDILAGFIQRIKDCRPFTKKDFLQISGYNPLSQEFNDGFSNYIHRFPLVKKHVDNLMELKEDISEFIMLTYL